MAKNLFREIGYYLIFVASIAVPIAVLAVIDNYFWGVSSSGEAGPIGIFLLTLSMPFVIPAIFISAIIAGNPHSGVSENAFIGIVGVEILFFLALIWAFIRWTHSSSPTKENK